MRILGIESTCDETGASIVQDGRLVRSNIVASQVDLHAKYHGVVPEIASRAHIENILPVLRESLAAANCDFNDLDAIAVAHRPGLIGSLLIGVTAAKTLAWSLGKPLIGVDHVHAHLYSIMLVEDEARRHEGTQARSGEKGEGHPSESNPPALSPSLPGPHSVPPCLNASVPSSPPFPAVGLVCSGGHTALYHLRSWLDVELIGSTIDDAVGEAYDKVAALLGLGYPGGPILDRLAQQGDPAAIRFPRSLMARDSLDFSFSGLKTAVLYNVHGVPTREHKLTPATPPNLSAQRLADLAASFQAACIDVLIRKIKRAIQQIHARSVIIGGGVSANQGLRTALANFPLPVFFPPLAYCTDNAAMSAGLAHLYLSAGQTTPLDLDAIPYSQFSK
ncbi:MAG: tRNA N6-adenosine threonylcarbamoyltransferase [Phycisphaerales bacterium]|nr:tRNA N6-adenosine threonylcarbamoyltransferase [Phycisphaerales bacterium]